MLDIVATFWLDMLLVGWLECLCCRYLVVVLVVFGYSNMGRCLYGCFVLFACCV